MRKLQKIINFCARVVSGRRKFDHISDIVERLGWLNAKSLVQYHTACSLFKTLRTGAPAYVARTIGPPRNAVHSHATRRSAELSLPRIRTEAGRRRLCYRGVSLLNELDIREAVPFKSTLRNVLLEKQRKETWVSWRIHRLNSFILSRFITHPLIRCPLLFRSCLPMFWSAFARVSSVMVDAVMIGVCMYVWVFAFLSPIAIKIWRGIVKSHRVCLIIVWTIFKYILSRVAN